MTNDKERRAAELVQQAREMDLTQDELRALLAKRPTVYAPLAELIDENIGSIGSAAALAQIIRGL